MADEWAEHERDHDRERRSAEDTAKRLEREVEQTAKRIEKAVEEQATRVQHGVEVALSAVNATARVHAEAHSKEHLAHERIHGVEKEQVDKAEDMMNERLQGMNEFRQALQDQSHQMVTRDLFDAGLKELNARLATRDGVVDARLTALDNRTAEAASTYVTGKTYDDRHRALTERVTAAERRLDVKEGQAQGLTSTGKVVAAGIAAVGTIIFVIVAVATFGR